MKPHNRDKTIKDELLKSIEDCSARGLFVSAKWSCEQLSGLTPEQLSIQSKRQIIGRLDEEGEGGGSVDWYGSEQHVQYLLAKSYFDLQQYLRCADVLQASKEHQQHPINQFLRLYSIYLASEKRFSQQSTELQATAMVLASAAERANGESTNTNNPNGQPSPPSQQDPLKEDLKSTISQSHHKSVSKELQQLCLLLDQQYNNIDSNSTLNNDGFLLYMYGMVLKRKGDNIKARTILAESLSIYPCNWSAWIDLANICPDLHTASQLSLPTDHFMYNFFMAHLTLDLQQPTTSIQHYQSLTQSFPNSNYILAQVAIANFNQRAYDVGEELFEKLLEREPHRLENIDIYSNILYVRDKKANLSMLARTAMMTEKYCPETCCIVGNYYSLKSEHDKAILYFQRALRLDENYLEAWTLIGQEFLETKNVSMAINAYRRAVDINSKDYRAWYGLGQTYQLLNLPLYSLYYFKKATTLRPYDPRMWCAVAGCYETIQRTSDAIRCYERAEENFDRENVALSKLAKLYQEMQNYERAAYYYKKNLLRHDHDKVDSKDTINALIFLANYHKNIKQYDECEKYCLRLLDYAGPEKEEARALLCDIHDNNK